MAWIVKLPLTPRHPQTRWQVRHRDGTTQRSAGIYLTKAEASASAVVVVAPPGQRPAPKRISGVLGTGISVAKTGLPPWLLTCVKHLASLHNPEFYQRQKLRLSTWQTPRFVRCYSEDLSHLHLPRGVLEPLRTLLENAGSRLDLADHRPTPAPLPARLQLEADLTGLQQEAVEMTLAHDHGVLVAPPGTGKTVMVARSSPPAACRPWSWCIASRCWTSGARS